MQKTKIKEPKTTIIFKSLVKKNKNRLKKIRKWEMHTG